MFGYVVCFTCPGFGAALAAVELVAVELCLAVVGRLRFWLEVWPVFVTGQVWS